MQAPLRHRWGCGQLVSPRTHLRLNLDWGGTTAAGRSMCDDVVSRGDYLTRLVLVSRDWRIVGGWTGAMICQDRGGVRCILGCLIAMSLAALQGPAKLAELERRAVLMVKTMQWPVICGYADICLRSPEELVGS